MAPRDRAQMHLAQSKRLEASGDESGALRELQKAAALVVDDPEITLSLGRLYSKQGNDGAALLALKRSVEISQDAESRRLLAELYLKQGNTDGATKLLALMPADAAASDENLPTQLRLVRSLVVKGKHDEALAVTEKLVSDHPEHGEALTARAEALIAAGRSDDAAQLLDKAVATHGSSVGVRLSRARFLSDRGMHDKALNELDRIAPEARDREDVVLARVRVMALLGRGPEATDALRAYIAAHPQNAEAEGQLAWLQLQTGDYPAARATAELMLRKRARSALALYVRARSLEAMQQDLRALEAYRDALDVDPGQTESLQRMWLLYEKLGMVPDAISALETLLRTGAASSGEKLELVRLYAETGLSPGLGIDILDELPKDACGHADCGALRAKLTEHRRKQGGGGGADGEGVQIIRGRR